MRNLPLQEMIAGTIERAKTKLAAEAPKSEGKKVEKLLAFEKKEHGHIPTPHEEEEELEHPEKFRGKEHEKTASSLVDDEYVEKLASAVDYISGHLDEITPAGPLAQALAKTAGKPGAGSPPTHGESVPSPVSTHGSLETTKAMGGEQKYKKDKAEGTQPEDEAHAALEKARPTDGKTQLENTMHSPPGGGSAYPAKGPLVAGPTAHSTHAKNQAEKTAGLGEMAGKLMAKHPAIPGAVAGSLLGGVGGAAGAEKGHRLGGAAKGALAGGAVGGGAAALAHHAGKLPHMAPPAAAAVKTAAEQAKEHILLKLAGEDVMKANIQGGGTSSPLAGKGQLRSMQAGEASPAQAGNATSGDGNEARRFIASNQAAIDMTKRDAKKPVVKPLGEVLDQPALSPKHDSKLQENLRNTGKAGVKIAGAQMRAELQKIASEGCTCHGKNECRYCTMTAKLATMGMGMPMGAPAGGGGMASMANAGAAPDGCTCGHTGECRVCKLEAAMHAAKGGHHGAEHHASHEKDATGAAC